MVQFILNPAYLPMADVAEIGLFGEILADESVGIFIQSFLPRMVGAAKIGFCLQCPGYSDVSVEFFAVIHGNGMDSGFMRLQYLDDGVGSVFRL
ncbi:Uncharacterised protein [Neisseria canis]|uniref:Uncharacterized protein n=1 Tax=Neisseria canis TaxID=493 RepID=A0A448D8L5_9NEIS|nr:Uncharacterised protein [Neisseria canis]